MTPPSLGPSRPTSGVFHFRNTKASPLERSAAIRITKGEFFQSKRSPAMGCRSRPPTPLQSLPITTRHSSAVRENSASLPIRETSGRNTDHLRLTYANRWLSPICTKCPSEKGGRSFTTPIGSWITPWVDGTSAALPTCTPDSHLRSLRIPERTLADSTNSLTGLLLVGLSLSITP